MKFLRLIGSMGLVLLAGCGRLPEQPSLDMDADLATARSSFQTRLLNQGPAPQSFEAARPPAGVREVVYASGDLELKAWLSEDPGDGRRRPAVVFLHGGWAFSPVDWQDAAPFVDAGFVLLIPMLRAENGNPGSFEGFYGEVDDAIAAGRFVSQVPYVDPDYVFVAGHSVGAVLTVLAAMMPSDYRAAAALSGYLDMAEWVADDDELFVFDTENPQEIRLRNPMEFAPSLRIPLILYAEEGGMEGINADFADLALRAGKRCELAIVKGDHGSMVAPSVQDAIGWFDERIDF